MSSDNGLLITLGGQVVLSKGINEDYTIDDVSVVFASSPRFNPELKFVMMVLVGDGGYMKPAHYVELDGLPDKPDVHIEIYKVDCSGGSCEKLVLGEKYGKVS